MPELPDHHGNLYLWRGDAAQVVEYPYVRDAIDIAVFNVYAKSGRLPPTRPHGFLDEDERTRWQQFRARLAGLADCDGSA